MYEETKHAVRQAFRVGEVLFSMGQKNFNRLVLATKKITPPTKEQLAAVSKKLPESEAIAEYFRREYAAAAVAAGFTEAQGLAMLTYAAMLQEIE